ncbi:hypothetical protein [Luteimonas huabeiensis]|uniref:hypothetical protein n=1 Tax=Luteimonas huabeiensis TaxID=1244513 RepID=UPI000465A797|nr:hypothetical protein [Luteimonas huabeiensis]
MGRRKNDAPQDEDRSSRRAPAADAAASDPEAGIAREVGDLEDPEATERDDALPGPAGGGLAGG